MNQELLSTFIAELEKAKLGAMFEGPTRWLLTRGGEVIYEGTPEKVVKFLQSYNRKV